MKRCALALLLAAMVLAVGVAQAQISLVSVIRDTGCHIDNLDGTPTMWGDGSTDPGPYFQDLDIVQGDHHLRSVHDTSVILDGSLLTVSGSYAGTVSTTDPGSIFSMTAGANTMVTFMPNEPVIVILEASFSGYGEVYFFDMTEWDGDFDHIGPGTFNLERALIPGHEYLFQVFHSVVTPQGTSDAEGTVSFSMAVGPQSVPAGEATWGSVKALYR